MDNRTLFSYELKKFYPALYKKTSTGAIQYWKINAEDEPDAGVIHIEFGQIGTGHPQFTSDYIYQGKNIGKKNETSRYQQALAESQAKWEKQKKKGYVETVEAARAEELDDLIQGGIVPMLAHSFADHAHKIKFPVYVQPKLDGIRCMALLRDGKCTLWTRTRKPITSVPHIVDEIERSFPGQTVLLDGELYNHELKADFERLVSLIRQETPHPDCKLIQYHVYDVPDVSLTWCERLDVLEAYFQKPFEYLRLVETAEIDEPDVLEYLIAYRRLGYEGAILRNLDGMYVNKRSYDLQKVKEFDDAEFPVIGINEGRGKLLGHVGAFVCRAQNGEEFEAKMSGSLDRLRDYWNDHSLWQGKIMTVQYQGLTTRGVPRFPVGVSFRDYE